MSQKRHSGLLGTRPGPGRTRHRFRWHQYRVGGVHDLSVDAEASVIGNRQGQGVEVFPESAGPATIRLHLTGRYQKNAVDLNEPPPLPQCHNQRATAKGTCPRRRTIHGRL